MSRIEFTNIFIDTFRASQCDPNSDCVYILTNIRADHFHALRNGWNLGPLYCSQITARLLANRFTDINCIKTLQLNTPTKIKMSKTLEVTVTFLQANHSPGAVMVLLQGYMGTILYTGNFRFDRQIFQRSKILYPNSMRNYQFQACSIHIDVLYIDNTFLKSQFILPCKSEAMEMIFQFVDNFKRLKQYQRIILGMELYGKEEILQAIAHHYKTCIVINQNRYQILECSGYDMQLFTTDCQKGFFEVVDRYKLFQSLSRNKQAIGLVLTDQCNQPTFFENSRIEAPKQITIQFIPYSIHCNYDQIDYFVNSIRPTVIKPIVSKLQRVSFNFSERQMIQYPIDQSFQYRQFLRTKQQRKQNKQHDYYKQLQYLTKKYYSPPSFEYSRITNDQTIQKIITDNLRSSNHSQINHMEQSANAYILQHSVCKLQKQQNQPPTDSFSSIGLKLQQVKEETTQTSDQDQVVELKDSSKHNNIQQAFTQQQKQAEKDPFSLTTSFTIDFNKHKSKSKDLQPTSKPKLSQMHTTLRLQSRSKGTTMTQQSISQSDQQPHKTKQKKGQFCVKKQQTNNYKQQIKPSQEELKKQSQPTTQTLLSQFISRYIEIGKQNRPKQSIKSLVNWYHHQTKQSNRPRQSDHQSWNFPKYQNRAQKHSQTNLKY